MKIKLVTLEKNLNDFFHCGGKDTMNVLYKWSSL